MDLKSLVMKKYRKFAKGYGGVFSCLPPQPLCKSTDLSPVARGVIPLGRWVNVLGNFGPPGEIASRCFPGPFRKCRSRHIQCKNFLRQRMCVRNIVPGGQQTVKSHQPSLVAERGILKRLVCSRIYRCNSDGQLPRSLISLTIPKDVFESCACFTSLLRMNLPNLFPLKFMCRNPCDSQRLRVDSFASKKNFVQCTPPLLAAPVRVDASCVNKRSKAPNNSLAIAVDLYWSP